MDGLVIKHSADVTGRDGRLQQAKEARVISEVVGQTRRQLPHISWLCLLKEPRNSENQMAITMLELKS